MVKIIILSLFLISGCTQHVNFRLQACKTVYCEYTENSKIKKAGYIIASIMLGVNLDYRFCNEYYSKRELFSGYVYVTKSAYEVCMEQ